MPATKKELQRFLGLVGYYRSFCKNFSTAVVPLTDLLKGEEKYVWSPSCQPAFDNVKSVLSSPPLHARIDLSNCTWMQVMQVQVLCCFRVMTVVSTDPMRFYSKKFRSFQLNYSVIEKETLCTLRHFEVYLNSNSVPLVVYTDHNPITFLHSLQCPNRRCHSFCFGHLIV